MIDGINVTAPVLICNVPSFAQIAFKPHLKVAVSIILITDKVKLTLATNNTYPLTTGLMAHTR